MKLGIMEGLRSGVVLLFVGMFVVVEHTPAQLPAVLNRIVFLVDIAPALENPARNPADRGKDGGSDGHHDELVLLGNDDDQERHLR